MALSPLPQPPSPLTLPPQQLLPSSFLKLSFLPSFPPPLPRPDTTGFSADRGVPRLRRFFFFLSFFFFFFFSFFFFLSLPRYSRLSLFSETPISLCVSLFCELLRLMGGSVQAAGGDTDVRKSREGVTQPLFPPLIYFLPLPRGRETGKRSGSRSLTVGGGRGAARQEASPSEEFPYPETF